MSPSGRLCAQDGRSGPNLYPPTKGFAAQKSLKRPSGSSANVKPLHLARVTQNFAARRQAIEQYKRVVRSISAQLACRRSCRLSPPTPVLNFAPKKLTLRSHSPVEVCTFSYLPPHQLSDTAVFTCESPQGTPGSWILHSGAWRQLTLAISWGAGRRMATRRPPVLIALLGGSSLTMATVAPENSVELSDERIDFAIKTNDGEALRID